MKKYTLSAIAFLLPQCAQAAFPYPPSADAGIVEKPIEKEYEAKPLLPHREVPFLEMDIPEEQLQIEGDIKVYVSKVELHGSTVYSDKTLQRLITPYLQRQLSISEIQELCRTLQAKYVQDGYFLTRVFPPVQEIQNGILAIEILEGNLGDVVVVGNKHYSEEFVKSYLSRFQGKPINYDDLLRAIFLLNENLDLSAGVVFQKGQRVGTADVILRVEDKLPLDIYVDYNNYGSNISSLGRMGTRIDYGNFLFKGAQLSFIEVLGFPPKDLNFTDVIYKIPLNRNGTALTLSYIYTPFHSRELKACRLRGFSSIADVEISQALQRTRRLSTDLSFNFAYKQIKNYDRHQVASFDRLRVLQGRIDVDYTDPFRGRNVGDFYVSWGIPDILHGLHHVDSLCSRRGAGGLFVYLNADYQRIQQIPWGCFLILSGSGQYSFYKLPIPEQMYIGGMGTVRGYPLATALGDDGYYFNVELRTPFPAPGMLDMKIPRLNKTLREFLQLVFFFDQGQVYLKGGGECQAHHVSLTGAGVGARVFGPWNINFSYDLGIELGKNYRSSNTISYYKLSWQIL